MIGQFAYYLAQMGAERDWEFLSFVTAGCLCVCVCVCVCRCVGVFVVYVLMPGFVFWFPSREWLSWRREWRVLVWSGEEQCGWPFSHLWLGYCCGRVGLSEVSHLLPVCIPQRGTYIWGIARPMFSRLGNIFQDKRCNRKEIPISNAHC